MHPQAFGIRRPDGVLDIGCGTGQTKGEAVRLAAAADAFGVDISEVAIARLDRFNYHPGFFVRFSIDRLRQSFTKFDLTSGH